MSSEATMDNTSLKYDLEKRKKAFAEKAPAETQRIYGEGIEAVEKAGALENAVNVGDEAPDFTLKNATGKEITLSDYLERGPVVLTWYRGGWCPYCNLTLRHLQSALPEFQAEGAQLLALTPEIPDKSLSTSEKHDLEFEVLSDIGNTVAEEYGIVFTLTPEVAESYSNFFSIEEYNGDDSQKLPLAATYVIDKSGRVTYAFLDADYRNRAEPDDVVAVLRSLK